MTAETITVTIEQRLSRKEVADLLGISYRATYRRQSVGNFPPPSERHPDRWVASQFPLSPVGVRAEKEY